MDKDLDKYINKRWNHYKLIEQYGGVIIKGSFFEGITNNVKFYCDLSNKPNSRILYYDFRSLYPTVLKYCKFPVGHLRVINDKSKRF